MWRTGARVVIHAKCEVLIRTSVLAVTAKFFHFWSCCSKVVAICLAKCNKTRPATCNTTTEMATESSNAVTVVSNRGNKTPRSHPGGRHPVAPAWRLRNVLGDAAHPAGRGGRSDGYGVVVSGF